MAPPATDIDVVVVGAGIAGLAAASHLTSTGLESLVLEARTRIGGRIESAAVDRGFADLGPTWFWPGETRVMSLAADLELPMHDQWITGDAITALGEHKQRVKGPVTSPAFRFTNGAASLTNAVAAKLPDDLIRLSTPVGRISLADNHVVVECEDGPLRARAVIITVPPAAISERQILTEHELGPDAATVLGSTPTWMGTTAKVVAVYDEPFWRHDGLSGTAIDHDGPLREIHDMSGPDGAPAALFGFAPMTLGQRAPTDDEAVAQLVRLFGPKAASPTQVLTRSWIDEAWTAAAVGSQRYELYGSDVLTRSYGDGRIVLASTETGTVAPGHIEGALQAAERAAAAVLSLSK